MSTQATPVAVPAAEPTPKPKSEVKAKSAKAAPTKAKPTPVKSKPKAKSAKAKPANVAYDDSAIITVLDSKAIKTTRNSRIARIKDGMTVADYRLAVKKAKLFPAVRTPLNLAVRAKWISIKPGPKTA
jgi:hypothetical protein